MKTRLILVVAIAATIGCDRVTKHLAETTLTRTPRQSFISDTIRLEYVENAGAFLSIGADWPRAVRTAVFGIWEWAASSAGDRRGPQASLASVGTVGNGLLRRRRFVQPPRSADTWKCHRFHECRARFTANGHFQRSRRGCYGRSGSRHIRELPRRRSDWETALNVSTA